MSFKSSRPNTLASLRLKCSSRLKLLAAAQMIKLNSNLKRSKVNWIELNFNLKRMKGWLCNLQPPFFHRIFAILLWKGSSVKYGLLKSARAKVFLILSYSILHNKERICFLGFPVYGIGYGYFLHPSYFEFLKYESFKNILGKGRDLETSFIINWHPLRHTRLSFQSGLYWISSKSLT